MRACRRQPAGHTPVWLMRQAGRYMPEYRELRSRVPFLELCKTPDLATQVTVEACQRLGVDAAILFSDILTVVEPFGFKLEFLKGDGPSISPVVRQAADLDRLASPDPDELDFVYQAVRQIRRELPQDIPLIGFAGAPFTIASYLIEGGPSKTFEATKLFMFAQPEGWHKLLSRLAAFTASYLQKQIEAGAQAIQLFDSWVGCLSPELYREFVLPHSQHIFQSLPGEVPQIHFGRGTGQLLELLRAAGGSVIGVDYMTSLEAAFERLSDSVALQGNLDPVILLADRPVIAERVKHLLDQVGGRPGHIFNLGHGLLPNTPVDNVRFLVDEVHRLTA